MHGTTAMPYGMLLTRLFRHISPIPPTPRGLRLDYSIIPHTIVPLSSRRVSVAHGKRPHPHTSSSPSSMSEDDTLPNSRLPPLEYLSQLPSIPNESEEFKQTKGMFKCFVPWKAQQEVGSTMRAWVGVFGTRYVLNNLAT